MISNSTAEKGRMKLDAIMGRQNAISDDALS
jgi:hypothetical protein